MNIAELAVGELEKTGEHDSLYFEDRWYTNKQMLDRSAQIAAGFCGLGVKRGDRVAVVLANTPQVLNTFAACFMIGAWCMPVMFTLTGEEMGFLFEDAGPVVVVTQKFFLDKVQEGRARTSSVKSIVTIDPEPVEGAEFMPDWFRELPADYPLVSCEPEDVCLIMYTSGTTGRPKGVMLTHDNMLFTGVSSSKARNIHPGDIFVSCLPLNHSYGIITWISSVYFGIKNVLMPRFDEEELFRYIQDFKCSAVSLVPTMLVRLLNHPAADKYDLTSLRRWGCASAPLALETLKQFEKKFPGKVIEAYGLTEASPTVTVCRMDEPYKDNSVGTAIEGVEVSIQDDGGKVLALGERGEICSKGRNTMKGYYNRAQATADAIRGDWLHTGDVGYMDEDGHLYITDRIKDLIIRGGENIFPNDIEEVLAKHPGVMEAAVIGMPDPDLGEEVMAVIVPRPGTGPTADDIIEFCSGHLGKFQMPKRVEFADTLPKNPIGKILKRQLREQYFKKPV